MRINFDQTLKNFDGTDAKHGEASLTLGLVCALALNTAKASDAKQALERGQMAMMVFGGGEHEVTPEQCVMCRSILYEAWAPAIVAQAYEMLDPYTVRES